MVLYLFIKSKIWPIIMILFLFVHIYGVIWVNSFKNLETFLIHDLM